MPELGLKPRNSGSRVCAADIFFLICSDFFLYFVFFKYSVFFQLFSAKVMGDPFLVGETGLLALKSAADQGQNQGQDSQMLLLEMFSKLLELLTLRHRLIEMSLESVHLARSVGGSRSTWRVIDYGSSYCKPCPICAPRVARVSFLNDWNDDLLSTFPPSLFLFSGLPTGLSDYSASLGFPLSTWAFSPFSHCLLIRCLMLVY